MGFRRDEALEGRRLGRATALRVLEFISPYRSRIVVFLSVVVAGAVTTAVPPLLLRALLDTAVPRNDRGMVSWLALGAVALALLNAAFALVQRWLSVRVGEGVIYDLRVALFDHVQRMPIAFFTRTQTGALQSRLNHDVVGAQRAVTNTLETVVANVISVTVTLAIMLGLEWRLTLLTLAVLPAFLWPARRVGPPLQRATRESMSVNAEMNTTIAERFNVAGALLVKVFGRRADESDGFSHSAARVRDIGVRTAMLGRILYVVLGLVGAVGTAVVYWIGGNLAISGTLTIGTIGAFVIYVGQIYQPLVQLTNARVEVLTALVSFERVFEVLDLAPAITDSPDATVLSQPAGRIAFDHVWFRHPPAKTVSIPSLETPLGPDGAVSASKSGEWVLRDICFTVDPGETVALVGPSGAGKTTIAMLVARVHDVSEGSVSVDSRDVRDVTLDSLQGAIGFVPQDPHLFHATIGENLRYARPSATDSEVEAALRAARVWDLVASLPEGLSTVVGERGYRMSGGEKQRLAIARLLLKDPAVVVLDEATSHLDSESEFAIQAALTEVLAGRTAIVIAHRLSTIVDADRILVVQDGQIVAEGRHEDLLAAGGLYEALYRTQLRGGGSPAVEEAV
ncbi:MAG: ABC transporter ATP-binding protein/permease [Acidimicrobiia bacterium]|nr:ABC transporter ATP-binding protein/permease [Acidimicrobiia bacterium]